MKSDFNNYREQKTCFICAHVRQLKSGSKFWLCGKALKAGASEEEAIINRCFVCDDFEEDSSIHDVVLEFSVLSPYEDGTDTNPIKAFKNYRLPPTCGLCEHAETREGLNDIICTKAKSEGLEDIRVSKYHFCDKCISVF